jgi:hypothetical protein
MVRVVQIAEREFHRHNRLDLHLAHPTNSTFARIAQRQRESVGFEGSNQMAHLRLLHRIRNVWTIDAVPVRMLPE